MAFRGKRSGFKDSDLSLAPEKELSAEEWDEKARGILLGRLSRGPRSKHQLRQLLAQKGVPSVVAEPLLDRFEEVHLIDDAAFARAFTNDRRASRGLSRSALKRELTQVGVSEFDIEDAIGDIAAEDDLELAIELVRKRWPSVAKLERDARHRRLAGFLGRRGFSGGAIGAAMRVVEQEAREAGEA